MSNQLKALPWVIDTPSATALMTKGVCLKEIRFTGYSNITDVCEVQDSNGNVIFSCRGNQNFEDVVQTFLGQWIQGILVPTTNGAGAANLSSGKIVVTLI